IAHAAGGEQAPGGRAGGIREPQQDRRGGARNARDGGVPGIPDLAAGGGGRGGEPRGGGPHAGGGGGGRTAPAAQPPPRGGAGAPADRPAPGAERADPGKDVPAVLPVGDRRLVHPELQEQVVDVGVLALRRRHDRDLGGQQVSAADPVDVHRVPAAHHRQQQRI